MFLVIVSSSKSVFAQGAKANIGWMAEHYDTILAWLPDNNNTEAGDRETRTVKA